jgi:hypothetical protein
MDTMILKLFRGLIISTTLLGMQVIAQDANEFQEFDIINDGGAYEENRCCCTSSLLENARFEVGYSWGKFIDIRREYAEIGLFLPLMLSNENGLWFGDGRGYRFNDSKWGASGGLGYRTWLQDSIVGANVYYDWLEGEFSRGFQRIGVGLEWLGSCWDIRVNGYIPIGKNSETGHRRVFDDFIGPFVATCRHKEIAIREGFDAEIGFPLGCWCDDFTLYAAAGPYYYRRHLRHDNFWGGYARLELGWNSYLFFQVRTSYDRVNHSETQGQVFLRIPFDLLCGSCGCDNPCLRLLSQPVRRNGIIFTKECCVFTKNW